LAVMSISTILTLKPFRCSGPRSCPSPTIPPGDQLRNGRGFPLYFCRGPTLWLFYHLSIISTSVYLPEKFHPLIVPSHPHAVHFLCIKIPLLWAVSLLAFHGILYSFGGPLTPECTHFNYISSFKRLLSPLLSRRLAVSLTSLFLTLNYLSIAWGAYRRDLPRVFGVGHSPRSPLFFLPHRSTFVRGVAPDVICVYTHGLISTILFVLMFRSTCLIIRIPFRSSLPSPSPPSLPLAVSYQFPQLTDHQQSSGSII